MVTTTMSASHTETQILLAKTLEHVHVLILTHAQHRRTCRPALLAVSVGWFDSAGAVLFLRGPRSFNANSTLQSGAQTTRAHKPTARPALKLGRESRLVRMEDLWGLANQAK